LTEAQNLRYVRVVLVPGWVCPYCGTDCSPIEGPPCAHFFLADGEFGWRFTPMAERLHNAAFFKHPTLFRDLLYHDNICRQHFILRRALYEKSLEVYAFTDRPEAAVAAFQTAIR
jgi:hypothetical protein